MILKTDDGRYIFDPKRTDEDIQKELKMSIFKITCPRCNSKVAVRVGRNRCPACDNEIDFSVDIERNP